MTAVAILGVYSDGPESTDNDVVQGQWSAWRISSRSPQKLWKDAEGALNAAIRRQGFINMYVYYGKNLPIQYALKVDQIEVYNQLSQAPGPAFDPSQRSHVWIRYGGIEELERMLPRNDFHELELIGNRFSEASKPLGESAWAKMLHTGLVFVEDPFIKDY